MGPLRPSIIFFQDFSPKTPRDTSLGIPLSSGTPYFRAFPVMNSWGRDGPKRRLSSRYPFASIQSGPGRPAHFRLFYLGVARQPLRQAPGMQLKKMVVVIVKVQGLALTAYPWAAWSYCKSMLADCLLVLLQRFGRNGKRDMIVGPFRQRLSFHDAEP